MDIGAINLFLKRKKKHKILLQLRKSINICFFHFKISFRTFSMMILDLIFLFYFLEINILFSECLFEECLIQWCDEPCLNGWWVKNELRTLSNANVYFQLTSRNNQRELVRNHLHFRLRKSILIPIMKSSIFQHSNIVMRHQSNRTSKTLCRGIPLKLVWNVNCVEQLDQSLNANSVWKICFASHAMTCFIVIQSDKITCERYFYLHPECEKQIYFYFS